MTNATATALRYQNGFGNEYATEAVAAAAGDGDLVLTLGAGNVSQLGPQLLERLGARPGLGRRNEVAAQKH